MQVYRCRSIDAGLQMQVYRCRSIDAGLQMQVYRCRSTDAGLQVQVYRCMFTVNRKFLLCVCDVPEPEARFNMDEFSELLIVNKPVVYISVSELLNTHQVRRESRPGPRSESRPGPGSQHAVFVFSVAVGAAGGSVPGPFRTSPTAAEGPWTSSHPAGTHWYYNWYYFITALLGTTGTVFVHEDRSGHQETSLKPECEPGSDVVLFLRGVFISRSRIQQQDGGFSDPHQQV